MNHSVTQNDDIRTVAITGGSGFIGLHVCAALARENFTVIKLSRSPNGKAKTWSLDATVEESASHLLGADAVIHLAAHLPVNYEDLDEAMPCYEANGIGTLNLLRAAKLAGVKMFVHISTAAIYTPSPHPVNESFPTIPQRATPYLASKLAAEVFASGFSFREGLATTTLRLASVYGPGMSKAGLVPNCVYQLRSSGRFTVADANRFRTDLVFVSDVVRTIVAAIKGRVTGTFNVASGRSVSPLELAKTAAQILGVSADGIEVAPAIGRGVPSYTGINIEKARLALALKPIDFPSGLSSYIGSLS